MNKKEFETREELELDAAETALEQVSQEEIAAVESAEPALTAEQELAIKKDRMRFVTNKLSSSLALLAILLNVFYFVSLYKNNNTYFYTYDMGASVLINLIFMLAVFLCSEGVKNYNKGYSIALIVIGVIELIRIFILPLSAHQPIVADDGSITRAMETAQFVRIVIYLAAAAALLVASGVIGVIRSTKLAQYKKSLEEKLA